MANKAYQLKLELLGSKPKIWRSIMAPSDLLLPDLHKIIQTTMGWTNSHLHIFSQNGKFYVEKMENVELWNHEAEIDYGTIKLSDLLNKENENLVYEYILGEAWEHSITLEKISS